MMNKSISDSSNQTGARLNGRIRKIDRLNDHLVIMHAGMEKGPVPIFEPGQFVNIGLPKGIVERDTVLETPYRDERRSILRRAYSIASSPNEETNFELLLNLVDHGNLTPRLWKLEEGDQIWIDPQIRGKFTLDGIDSASNLLFAATGTGIAPFVSMMRTFQGKNRWNHLTILYGARKLDDMGYHSEIKALADLDVSITYLPTLSREPADSNWDGARGWVQDLLSKAGHRDALININDASNTHAFLCGNSDMINEVKEILKNNGYVDGGKRKNGNIHTEIYY